MSAEYNKERMDCLQDNVFFLYSIRMQTNTERRKYEVRSLEVNGCMALIAYADGM